MKFSVVIPTYNRSVQLMLTLAAFEKQTCPADQFEIVVVNDGSKDDTLLQLQQYQAQAPYRLRIVTLSDTTGRSMARNVGVAASKEDYIIFCDPDFVVTPDFIQVHESYHLRYRDSIISGIPNLWRGAYLQVHAEFSQQERISMSEVLKPTGLWQDQYFTSPDTIEIVTKEDIRGHTDQLAKVIAPFDPDLPVNQQFRKTDVAPWLLSVTRNLSMPKHLFKQVGGFYERFQMHGLEDWELGYRLHRRGFKFISIQEVIGYHQEHPSAHRSEDSGQENLRMMFQNHGFLDPELSLFAVCPPSVNIVVYKNMLRILRSWSRSRRPSYRRLAAKVTRACTRSAKLFCNQPDSPAYTHTSSVLKNAFLEADQVYQQKLTKVSRNRKIKHILSRACRNLRRLPSGG